MQHWDLLLVRKTKNKLNTEITRRKLKKVAEAASRNRSLGFVARVGKLSEPSLVIDERTKEEIYCYCVRVRLTKPVVRNRDTLDEKFQHVLKVVSRCAGSEGWSVLADDNSQAIAVDGATSEPPPVEVVRQPFTPPTLTPEVFQTFFEGVYERDPHIRTIHDAACSRATPLSHVLLYGLPGACKTILCKRFKDWYEHQLPEGSVQEVMFCNNISTTKAGLENLLLDLAEEKALPHILVVDEIEKQPLENLLCLNMVMSEGLISKLNARVGHRRAEARFMVIGICNDENKLREFQNGHLWSRFTHKLRCVRPGRELCRHILRREVSQRGGQEHWADLALTFGWDELGQRDIREIRGHLDGGRRLEDGSWQKDQRTILTAARHEDQIIQG